MWEHAEFLYHNKHLPIIEPGEAKVVDFEKIQRGKVLKVYEGWLEGDVARYVDFTRQAQQLVGGTIFNGRTLRIIIPDKQIVTPQGPATISEKIPGKQAWEDRSANYQGFLTEISLKLQQELGNGGIVIITKNAKLPTREIAVTDIAASVRTLVDWR